jgi:predicted dehydrogenase
MLREPTGHALTTTSTQRRTVTKTSAAVAVVGCGYWGSKHVRVLSGLPSVSQVFAVDANSQTRDQIRTAFPSAAVAPDLAAVLRNVDGVIVATPPHNHVEIATLALSAGKSVLIEKPIATSLRDAQHLVRMGKRNGAAVIAGHTYEFNPIVHDLRRRIVAGEFGEIRYLHSERLNLGLYRTDVNVIWDLAPHDISIMNFLLNETPRSVRAWGVSCAGGNMIDVAHFQLEYPENGLVGTGFNSWTDPRRVRQLTIVGSKKMAVFDDVADEKLKIFDHSVKLQTMPVTRSAMAVDLPVATYNRGDVVIPKIEYEEPLHIEDRKFVEGLLNPSRQYKQTHSGVEVVKVLEAIDLSIAAGKPVLVKGRRVMPLQ